MKKLTILLPVLGTLAACSSTSPGVSTSAETVTAPECVFADAPDKPAPLWVCDVPIDGYPLTAVGFSEKKPSSSMTKSAATAEARAKMSGYFAAEISELLSEYQKSLETQDEAKYVIDIDTVRESVTSMTLYGTQVIRSLTSPTGGQYVLLAMDAATYQANTEKTFAALEDSDAEMKQLFSNEQARERLTNMIKVQ